MHRSKRLLIRRCAHRRVSSRVTSDSASTPLKGSHVKKRSEEISQTLPGFKSDARNLRRGGDTLGNDCIVAIAAEGLETKRVDFGAAEPESGYDMQAEEMAAMRPERRARPAGFSSTSTICR